MTDDTAPRTTTATEESGTDDLAGRFLTDCLGAIDMMSVYLGDRLGWYRSLSRDGPATPHQLAERTGTHPRYAREWLEQQAVTGLLALESQVDTADGDTRVYSIPDATVEVMTDELSVNYLAPLARMFAGVAPQLPALLDVYRTGGGVGWESMGVDAREAQADMNRPWFESHLADALTGVEDVHSALSLPGAAILDVGCGGAWSTIALARAYPSATLHGIDIDPASVTMARENVAAAGLSERILPDSMSHHPTAATGTVLREATMRRIAADAGYVDTTVLPIEDFGFWRFYRLDTAVG